MKRYLPLIVIWALAVAPLTVAEARDDASKKAEKKAEKADKAEKTEKADKADKAGKADDVAKADDADNAAAATAPAGQTQPAQEQKPAQEEKRDDAVLDPAQPDFTLVNLPTTLRLPKFKSAFRVTHRFSRPLGDGSFGDLAEDFFGMDNGAQIGLEYRFGLWHGSQVGINRTSDRTIQFFGQYDIRSQSESFPVGLMAYASIEGTNNLRDDDESGEEAHYTPALGVVVSRSIAQHAAIYVAPIWVNNSNQEPSELVDDNSTFLLGIGGRVRVRPTVYAVVEFTPRVAGDDPGVHSASFGIEKRVGGHAFQVNFSNSFGTTMGQIARGGIRNLDGDQNWYIGFNISRKFF